jgi:uncharacterized protein YndB with AHSA1/START domain
MSAKSSEAFVSSRVFDAPRERVWKAWTEPERLKQWWGPKGFKVFSCKVDLRPGGKTKGHRGGAQDLRGGPVRRIPGESLRRTR